VDVPDYDDDVPGTVPGCGCSVQTCCDAIAASEGTNPGYLGCAPVMETDNLGGEICNQVQSGIIDGSKSVCDLPVLANGPTQLTTSIVDATCQEIQGGDTCIPVNETAYYWWRFPIPNYDNGTCRTTTFPEQGLGISILSKCDGFLSGGIALPFSICEQGQESWCEVGNSTGHGQISGHNPNCAPPFGNYGPTDFINPNNGGPGGVGMCQPMANGRSVIFTVTGEWPCAPETPGPTVTGQTPEPTVTFAPTPHHHHHDGAVADARDAALGSVVVAALTAAVLA